MLRKVFPACAGMFLAPPAKRNNRDCFPRVRGDVPSSMFIFIANLSFSPRARGCSVTQSAFPVTTRVFPACAGMFRIVVGRLVYTRCFPRVRGDVPDFLLLIRHKIQFSPRARGCSLDPPNNHCTQPVFPACAGMFPVTKTRRHKPMGFPRVRGDVPKNTPYISKSCRFSPRARGCSRANNCRTLRHRVFPACAGMFLRRSNDVS